MLKSIIIILFVIIIIVIGETIIRNKINNFEFYKPNDTPHYILEVVEKFLNNINLKDFIFIDLGCGIGNILDTFSDDCKLSIGVEHNKYIYMHLVDKYTNNKKIKIVQSDLIDFIYPQDNLIIYIHEPFWDKSKNQRKKLYKKVIEQITQLYQQERKNILFIYCSSLINKSIDENIFNQWKLISHIEIPFSEIIPLLNYDIYFYQVSD